jgi:hypothetical protein
MGRPASRGVLFSVVALAAAVISSGCVTFGFESEPLVGSVPPRLANPTAAASAAASATPSHASPPPNTTVGARPSPTPDPTIAPGPPFAPREPGVVVVDAADVFAAETEEKATQKIGALTSEDGASVVVYAQIKPGSTEATTERDAKALTLGWRLGDGIVIMWNAAAPSCDPAATDNQVIQLYAGPRFSTTRLSEHKRQQILDEKMQPLLQDCDADAALLAALDAIADEVNPPTTGTGTTPGAKGACADPEFKLAGHRWQQAFQWYFDESSVPDDYRASDVLEVLIRSADNITGARNDCGLADKVDAEAQFMGPTERVPCEAESGDGINTIGFGELPDDVEEDTIAFVCPYGTRTNVREVDMLINSDISWALSAASCKGFQELLEATITHEFGHIFGLSHVPERTHGDLTMSPMSNGACVADEITLGLGDVRGLEELY